jgi:hypothetical protein
MMAVSVTWHPAFSPGAPVKLFGGRMLQFGYDASNDGKRFVVATTLAGGPPIAIHVVRDWFAEFRGK